MSITTTDRRSVILGPKGEVIYQQPDPMAERHLGDVVASVGSFRGTIQTEDRGLVWLPTLDSKKEIDSWSRLKGMERARYLMNNGGGLPQRAVYGIARMIVGSGLLPLPLPKKVQGQEMRRKEWIRKVQRRYRQRAGNALVYDLSQRRNVMQFQTDLASARIRDGDAFVAYARDDSGRLRRRFYEGHQVGNGRFPAKESDGWYDGVRCDAHNAALGYRILGTDSNGREIKADVDAMNVLHFMEQGRGSAVRGMTRFVPILNQIFDRGEIMAAITKGVKVTSHVAYVIEQANTAAKAPGAPGTTLGGKQLTQVELADGSKVNLEKFLSGGEARTLKAGQSFKIIQGENPHPNVHAHIDEITRSIAWCFKYAPEVIWKVIELGGANSRFVLLDTQGQLEEEQTQLVDCFLGPDYVIWLREEIEATRDLPDGDDNKIEEIEGWERHGFIYPGRLTVDFGRDNRAYIEAYKRGLITMKSMYGMQGEDWEPEVDQYLDERQYIAQGRVDRKIVENGKERSMTWEETFPEVRQTNMSDSIAGEQSQSDPAQVEDMKAQMERVEQKLTDIAHVLAFSREPKS